MNFMRDADARAARLVCVGFDGPEVTDDLRQLIARGVSSVILFTRNFQSQAQLGELCREIKGLTRRPILIGVDQEGGRVQRFTEGFTLIPSMRDLAATGDEATVYAFGRTLATELRAVGVDLNFAPVLDVDSNPLNPVIGTRSFSDDPETVSRLGCAMIRGLQGDASVKYPDALAKDSAVPSVAACGKHFPGHGDTSVDSHLVLPRLVHDRARLDRVELPPFRAAIQAGVAAIMTSHVLFEAIDPTRPATMSAAVIDGLLRQQLGFDRVVFSDDLEMKAVLDHYGIEQTVTQAAIAGVDVMCVCSRHDLQHLAIEALIKAVERGSLHKHRLIESNHRIDALMERFVS